MSKNIRGKYRLVRHNGQTYYVQRPQGKIALDKESVDRLLWAALATAFVAVAGLTLALVNTNPMPGVVTILGAYIILAVTVVVTIASNS